MAGEGKRPPRRATPQVERIVAAIGAAVFAAFIGYLGWSGLARPDGPPDLSVALLRVQPVSGGFLVDFVARNDGPRTAAAVRVTGRLSEAGHAFEESTATLDYVPQHSEREGGLMFQADPRAFHLTLRVEGFAYP